MLSTVAPGNPSLIDRTHVNRMVVKRAVHRLRPSELHLGAPVLRHLCKRRRLVCVPMRRSATSFLSYVVRRLRRLRSLYFRSSYLMSSLLPMQMRCRVARRGSATSGMGWKIGNWFVSTLQWLHCGMQTISYCALPNFCRHIWLWAKPAKSERFVTTGVFAHVPGCACSTSIFSADVHLGGAVGANGTIAIGMDK